MKILRSRPPKILTINQQSLHNSIISSLPLIAYINIGHTLNKIALATRFEPQLKAD